MSMNEIAMWAFRIVGSALLGFSLMYYVLMPWLKRRADAKRKAERKR